ncbi:MAG TPA: lasso peptide biosynthesis B2 protein [Terriglobales bacterium]|nr:lasso peptide biosynthesis B2 protein [Terriglobales bacterium]
MSSLHKFLRLPPARRLLLAEAFAIACAMRVASTLFSLPRLQRFIAGLRPNASRYSEQDICGAAAAASRRVPGGACLVEALTAHYLLSRAGYAHRLRIGVRQEGQGLAAHAWVELESNMQGRDFGVSYTVLPL